MSPHRIARRTSSKRVTRSRPIPSTQDPTHYYHSMEPIIHLPSHRVIIYTDSSCEYAVLTSYIDRHLLKRYKVTAGKRRDVVNQIMAIPEVFVNKEYLQVAFQNLPPNQPAIPHLPVYSDGLGCSYIPCQYICRGKTSMTDHLKAVHQWVNPHRRGGSLRSRKVRVYL